MNEILLKNIVPNVFTLEDISNSEIWNKEILFEKGTKYLIKAESGKGKSTLCSFIYGYRNDFSGSLLFDNKDVKKTNNSNWNKIRTQNIAILYQELKLFNELSSIENVFIKNRLTQFKTNDEILSMFDALKILSLKDKKVEALSWGQKQRVAIIRTLCQPFNFILLDEPISHLDDNNSKIIATLVEKEAEKQNATIITTSIGKDLPINYNKTYIL